MDAAPMMNPKTTPATLPQYNPVLNNLCILRVLITTHLLEKIVLASSPGKLVPLAQPAAFRG